MAGAAAEMELAGHVRAAIELAGLARAAAEEVAKLPHSLAFHLARPPVSAAMSERQASLLRPLPSQLAPRERSPCSGRRRARTWPDHCTLARHGRGPAP